MSDAAAAGEAGKEPKKSKLPPLPVLLALVNAVAILAALGTAVYTKILFQRPPITEEGEREKLHKASKKPEAKTTRGLIELPAMTFNIANLPGAPNKGGKLHYGNASITIEIANVDEASDFEEIKPIFLDRLVHLLGKKTFEELTTVQGRYVLRMEILEVLNGLMKRQYVTNVFFTKFLVQ